MTGLSPRELYDFFETQAPNVRNCVLKAAAFAFSEAAHCFAAPTVACCCDADAAFACAETQAPNDEYVFANPVASFV